MNNTLGFQGAIFDLDGTLLDSMHVWKEIDLEFLAKRGFDVPLGYSESLAGLSFRETAEYTIATFGLKENPDDIMQEWNQMAIEAYRHKVRLKPHAEEYLLWLKERGIRLAVCTALSRKLYVPALQNNRIYHLFDAFVSTDDVNRGKNFPDAYLLAASRLGLAPQDCVVFEDILPAIHGALAANMQVYGVFDPASEHDREEIERITQGYLYDFREMMIEPKETIIGNSPD